MNLAPHPFSLRQLQYAVAVADARSFSDAAGRCRVSQPSLSAQIAQLEDALGARLFERDRRRVLLTPAGEQIVARARIVLRESDDLVDLAHRSTDPLTGAIRIGVIPTLSPYLISCIRPGLLRAYPALTLLWVEDKTEVLIGRLGDGELDAALLALEAEIGDVESAVIGYDPFVLVAPVGHPLVERKRPAKVSELENESVLLLDDGHCFRDQALAVCSRAKAQELEFRATSLPTLVQMVADGNGVTLLPQLAVATEATRAKLAVRPFAEPAPGRTIALVWRRRSPLASALQQVARTAGEAFAALEPAPTGATRSGAGRRRQQGVIRRRGRTT
ncbi:MAG: LysR family transcriptional regulator [Deltaproteobacteria bacterium]|nr:LysR family transcriptional regulator [Deltaproteobacteria bacterium]